MYHWICPKSPDFWYPDISRPWSILARIAKNRVFGTFWVTPFWHPFWWSWPDEQIWVLHLAELCKCTNRYWPGVLQKWSKNDPFLALFEVKKWPKNDPKSGQNPWTRLHGKINNFADKYFGTFWAKRGHQKWPKKVTFLALFEHFWWPLFDTLWPLLDTLNVSPWWLHICTSQ